VLLSPAAPSYDTYRNFEERGDDFRMLVAPMQPRYTNPDAASSARPSE
jgi:hypothetical protein